MATTCASRYCKAKIAMEWRTEKRKRKGQKIFADAEDAEIVGGDIALAADEMCAPVDQYCGVIHAVYSK